MSTPHDERIHPFLPIPLFGYIQSHSYILHIKDSSPRSFLLIFILSLLIGLGCTSTYPNQNPIQKKLPSFKGTDLNQRQWNFPNDFQTTPTLFLFAYKQDTQFDVDRWLIGLDMMKVKIKAYEVPTIQGMIPRMFKTKINQGMREGIPKDLWGGVITIYQDGQRVQQWTGNEFPNNVRVVLMNPQGQVIYFYDQGFSLSALKELKTQVDRLNKQTE